MSSALDDLIEVVEWLAATKTPPVRVADALVRLKARAHHENRVADEESAKTIRAFAEGLMNRTVGSCIKVAGENSDGVDDSKV